MESLSLKDTIKEITRIHLDNGGILMGECVSDPGGVAGTIPQHENVIDLPMTETAGADFAVGCALVGRRPIFVVRFQDFMLMNGSPFVNFAAVVKPILGLTAPVFIRGLSNDRFDATHSNVLHSLFMQYPGIDVCAPCTPKEYREVWDVFMKKDVPVYVSEYRDTFMNTSELPDIIQNNAVINVLGISVCRQEILKAKEILEKEGIIINVLNAMRLKPLDISIWKKPFENCKIGLVVEPGREICGAAEHIAFEIMREYSGTKVDILGVKDKIKTTNPEHYNEYPHEQAIVKKVHEMLGR